MNRSPTRSSGYISGGSSPITSPRFNMKSKTIYPSSPKRNNQYSAKLSKLQIDDLGYYFISNLQIFNSEMLKYLDKFDNGNLYPDKYELDSIARAIYFNNNFNKYHISIERLESSLNYLLSNYSRSTSYFVIDIYDTIIEMILYYTIEDIVQNKNMQLLRNSLPYIVKYDRDNELIYKLLSDLYNSNYDNKLDIIYDVIILLRSFYKTRFYGVSLILSILKDIMHTDTDSYNYLKNLLSINNLNLIDI